MANLSFLEKKRLEQLFGMGSGYVLDFSNRTFEQLVADVTDLNIYDNKFNLFSGSKANRLRAFWEKEPNHVVGKLIVGLLDYCADTVGSESPVLFEECMRTAKRLLQDAPVQDVEAISPNAEGRGFEALAKSVKRSIENNEPESGLDRLHTFVVKYVRVLCQKHGITTVGDKALHSLFGEYVKELKKAGLIESEMTERILKSSISILEAFNKVRNDLSFAHDNPVLNYDESLLIFNHVASSIRFVTALEQRMDKSSDPKSDSRDDEVPF